MKKIVFVSLALVLALGGLGVGYAMWSDTVTVTTNMATGSVGIEITGQLMTDDDAPPPYYPTATPDYTCRNAFAGPAPYFWEMGDNPLYPDEVPKNVSWGECSFKGDTMTAVLHDTYPSNFHEITLYVGNTGTVPVKIQETEVYKWDVDQWVKIVTWDAGYPTISIDMDNDPNDYELDLHYGDNFGGQLEPGQGDAEISYWIHTRQDAAQGATYKLKFVLLAVQYNEYVAP
jgi:hypothetical protein